MPEVRAKFKVTEVRRFHWAPESAEIHLEPVYDESIPEDGRFAKATPTGDIRLNVDNPIAVAKLTLQLSSTVPAGTNT